MQFSSNSSDTDKIDKSKLQYSLFSKISQLHATVFLSIEWPRDVLDKLHFVRNVYFGPKFSDITSGGSDR